MSSIYYHVSSVNYHVYFLQDIKFIFCCLSFVSAGKGRRERERVLFWFLSSTSTCFANRLVFSVCIYRRGLMMNEDFACGSWNHATFFVIKTSVRIKKRARFLGLHLNISFQPLIIAAKHSIIKLDVTELLDPPQVFTCWESQGLFCFMKQFSF